MTFKNLTSFLLLLLVTNLSIQSQDLESQIDQLVTASYGPEEPGVSILVAKNGKPIYRKAFGQANLELDVAMTPENVFQIGSITKQFTAVAILMLEEQGTLSVQDDILKYIPDYPTQGKTITIHHLLNHTSGIKSYTSMPNFIDIARTDMTPTELIDVFKNEPMDFDPGERYLYNNSGYILLGHIIEVVTKDSYENFIEKNIFEKLGMTSSMYGSTSELIDNRAYGYQQTDSGYRNADYLSLTLPYAAGSLMSTVDDLLIWQNAMSANKLVSEESWKRATTKGKLNNGDDIEYGYGWSPGEIAGSKGVAHSGGIFGYTTNGVYLFEEDVYVIALSNCNCKNVSETSMKIAAMAIGKPFPDIKDAITLSADQLKKWEGAYQFEDEVIRHIFFKEGKLYSLREGTGNQEYQIYPLSEDTFIFEEGYLSMTFRMNDGQKEVVFKSESNESVGKEIDKERPETPTEIKVDANVLNRYQGTYELQPNFIITITTDGDQIFAQATGQPKFELFATSETEFFLKVVPAKVTFNLNEQGDVVSLTLDQGGRSMPAKKTS